MVLFSGNTHSSQAKWGQPLRSPWALQLQNRRTTWSQLWPECCLQRRGEEERGGGGEGGGGGGEEEGGGGGGGEERGGGGGGGRGGGGEGGREGGEGGGGRGEREGGRTEGPLCCPSDAGRGVHCAVQVSQAARSTVLSQ